MLYSGIKSIRMQSKTELIELIEKDAVEDEAFAKSLGTAGGQEKDKKLYNILEPRDTAKTGVKGYSSDEKIKVSTARLDNLINMAGELVIAQLMLAEEVNTSFASDQCLGRKVTHQGKIVRDIQELSMSMRMIPIAGVFQKMARLVRDLSHTAGKDVSFFTSATFNAEFTAEASFSASPDLPSLYFGPTAWITCFVFMLPPVVITALPVGTLPIFFDSC